MGTNPSGGGYLPINGLNLYHEVYGDLDTHKPPLLLIPGAFMATDSMTAWTAAFAQERAVIVFDQQGHGRTPTLRGDVLRAVRRRRRCVAARYRGGACGCDWLPQGGGVALQLAIRHEPLINNLSRCSAMFRKDGWYPSVTAALGALSAETFAGTPLEEVFKKHTPDADAFATYVEKMKALNINDQNISDQRCGQSPPRRSS